MRWPAVGTRVRIDALGDHFHGRQGVVVGTHSAGGSLVEIDDDGQPQAGFTVAFDNSELQPAS